MNWVSYDFKRQKAGALGEVLDRITYPCGFCKGTGIPPSKKCGACLVCAGKGTVDVGRELSFAPIVVGQVRPF